MENIFFIWHWHDWVTNQGPSQKINREPTAIKKPIIKRWTPTPQDQVWLPERVWNQKVHRNFPPQNLQRKTQKRSGQSHIALCFKQNSTKQIPDRWISPTLGKNVSLKKKQQTPYQNKAKDWFLGFWNLSLLPKKNHCWKIRGKHQGEGYKNIGIGRKKEVFSHPQKIKEGHKQNSKSNHR